MWVRDRGLPGIPAGSFHPLERMSRNLVQEILDLLVGSGLCRLRAQFRYPWGARYSQQGSSYGMLVLWPSPSFILLSPSREQP